MDPVSPSSSAERHVAARLCPILLALPATADIPDSTEFRYALGALEYFIPQLLRELHPEWQHESLDGIRPARARKTAPLEIEIFGLCYLITDQTTTPLHLRLQLSPSIDEVTWLECRLGEQGPDGLIRLKIQSQSTIKKRLHALESRDPDAIPWTYRITFGQRSTFPHS